jgi:DNA-binding NtrC family response regulator
MANILVIDDDSFLRGMIRQVLEKAGHTVREAPDGEVGLKLFIQQPADLVLTDMIMPNKEGIETIKAIHTSKPDAKIIAMSAGGKVNPQSYLRLAERLGAIRTFDKGEGGQKLKALIDEVLAV